MDTKCPICNLKLVLPSGPHDAPILILGDSPGQEEIKEGEPFIGVSGRILRVELGRVGIDKKQCRVSNLFLHEKNKDCLDWNLEQAIREARDRKAILLLGADCSKIFLKKNVTDVTGLFMTSDLLSCKIIMATVNPASLLHESGVGEIRLAFKRFAKRLEKEGIL